MTHVTRHEIYERCKKEGVEAVRKSVTGMNNVSKPIVDQYIHDYEISLREAESLSISRRALLISKIAMISAVVATIIAAIAMIFNVISTP